MDSDEELLHSTLVLADELLRGALEARRRVRRIRRRRLRRLLREESGTKVAFSLADRVLRPSSTSAAAIELRAIASDDLRALSVVDRLALRVAASATHLAERPVVALVRGRIRLETSPYIVPLEPRRLRRALRRLARANKRPNLNVLGEAILGWGEARQRTATLEALLARPDVDCVSVKVSSIAPGASLVDFDGSLERAAEPLRHLYRLAAASKPPKLINLDMEEHRDLDLTLELFCRILAEPEFADLSAGIALQAYLPDTHQALDRLLEFAATRQNGGGAPVRVRLVKGANLAMERVDAELHGWPSPVLATKATTDASYVALLERLIRAQSAGLVRVGVATHNLFDLALALVLAKRAETMVDVEMLAGMADDQADAVVRRLGHLLLYVPVTSRRDFRNAMAYLARRLDENATPEGFLRHALDLAPHNEAWRGQAERFAASLADRHHLDTTPAQRQDRTAEVPSTGEVSRFANEPDTDLTVAANRRFARSALGASHEESPPAASPDEVEAAVRRALAGAEAMRAMTSDERRSRLRSVADAMVAGRKEAIATMASETGKTFEEGDPEVSEAIDYARWYAKSIDLLDALDVTTESEPLGVLVVASPWNFPYAIPASGVLAALAAGNAVILKPSPEAVATGALLVEHVRRAGFAPHCVQLVPALDDDAGEALITHPDVDGVVLTGSFDTALRFARWSPRRRLLAETSGKNAVVVSATADVDLAVRDIVRSAFGHAGQKCSAASLAIVDASVHDHSPFLRQLADATRSLRVGEATDPSTEVGPIVGPMTPALARAVGELEPGERWLVEPKRLSERLIAPGVRVGVRPGSWTHQTEWFGPVLGVMRASSLNEAVNWQNGVDFGLTAGLHALDPEEQRSWLERVEAGNCYINRPTTGAIVGRQPFGGWKRSSFGPTAKAGGPNYLLGFRRWRDRSVLEPGVAAASYERAWSELRRPVELAGLASESNDFRYRPFLPGVTVRLGPHAMPGSIERAAAVAAVVGTPLSFSSPVPIDPPAGFSVTTESPEELASRLRAGYPGRLRLLGEAEAGVFEAAAEGGVSVLDEPICAEGRLELVRWLREQVISRSLHRYGNVVYPRFDLAESSRSESSR